MTSTATLNKDELRQLIADVLDVDPAAVTDDAHFINDLEADSLLALELAVTLEREYGVQIESVDIVDVQRFSDVLALMAAKLRDRQAAGAEPLR